MRFGDHQSQYTRGGDGAGDRNTAARISPRQAAGFSCYFLNVLAGRTPAAAVERYATKKGWVAFSRARRLLPSRPNQTRLRRLRCPNEETAELVALLSDGRAHRAMTFTFRLTRDGWRLDDCELIRPAHAPHRRR